MPLLQQPGYYSNSAYLNLCIFSVPFLFFFTEYTFPASLSFSLLYQFNAYCPHHTPLSWIWRETGCLLIYFQCSWCICHKCTSLEGRILWWNESKIFRLGEGLWDSRKNSSLKISSHETLLTVHKIQTRFFAAQEDLIVRDFVEFSMYLDTGFSKNPRPLPKALEMVSKCTIQTVYGDCKGHEHCCSPWKQKSFIVSP